MALVAVLSAVVVAAADAPGARMLADHFAAELGRVETRPLEAITGVEAWRQERERSQLQQGV